MLKFAFLINVPGQSPDTYSAVYENSESYNLVAGTGDMEMAKEFVAKLAAEGYTLFNLCGDFDDEITAQMQQAAGPDVKIRHADYFPEQLADVEALEEFTRYGMVIVMRGVEEPAEVELSCDDLWSKAIFVKDQEQANEAAKKLAGEGVHDIELCSWFDKAKTEAVIEAVGGAVPVGSCGDL
ncbi:MAG: hypothetical protein IJ128_04190 [Firmicutes bacterium]|nr:hypothetical protein [Bacillota bacterium]